MEENNRNLRNSELKLKVKKVGDKNEYLITSMFNEKKHFAIFSKWFKKKGGF